MTKTKNRSTQPRKPAHRILIAPGPSWFLLQACFFISALAVTEREFLDGANIVVLNEIDGQKCFCVGINKKYPWDEMRQAVDETAYFCERYMLEEMPVRLPWPKFATGDWLWPAQGPLAARAGVLFEDVPPVDAPTKKDLHENLMCIYTEKRVKKAKEFGLDDCLDFALLLVREGENAENITPPGALATV